MEVLAQRCHIFSTQRRVDCIVHQHKYVPWCFSDVYVFWRCIIARTVPAVANARATAPCGERRLLCIYMATVVVARAQVPSCGIFDQSQDSGQSSPVRSALRGGKWLLADSAAQRVVAEPGQRKILPIKSVRGRGLSLNLSTEMGDCSVQKVLNVD